MRADYDSTREDLGFGDGDVPPILCRGATRWQGQPASFKRGNLSGAFIGEDADHDFSLFGEFIGESAVARRTIGEMRPFGNVGENTKRCGTRRSGGGTGVKIYAEIDHVFRDDGADINGAAHGTRGAQGARVARGGGGASIGSERDVEAGVERVGGGDFGAVEEVAAVDISGIRRTGAADELPANSDRGRERGDIGGGVGSEASEMPVADELDMERRIAKLDV